jgi:hypothetical protein
MGVGAPDEGFERLIEINEGIVARADVFDA